MAYTYEELKKMTVAALREIAKGIEHEAVKGYSQLNKEHLLQALCQALGIDAHIHHQAKVADKAATKSRMRALKKKRDQALAAHDQTQLKFIRRQLHHLKRNLNKAAV